MLLTALGGIVGNASWALAVFVFRLLTAGLSMAGERLGAYLSNPVLNFVLMPALVLIAAVLVVAAVHSVTPVTVGPITKLISDYVFDSLSSLTRLPDESVGILLLVIAAVFVALAVASMWRDHARSRSVLRREQADPHRVTYYRLNAAYPLAAGLLAMTTAIVTAIYAWQFAEMIVSR